jgi:hypothetical protein
LRITIKQVLFSGSIAELALSSPLMAATRHGANHPKIALELIRRELNFWPGLAPALESFRHHIS